VDPVTPSGSAIPIEERAADEITSWRGQRVAADDVEVWNPAFDVTPADLVTAFVTDRGVLAPSDLARTFD
jgi:methylthioribose-1-phosphate isomerase